MRIAVMHLDLGIGGAERLIVNIACACKELGHDVDIYTTHHDQNHCFDETKKPNGYLSHNIHVSGDSIPTNICGKLTALCSVVRMIYITLFVFTPFQMYLRLCDSLSFLCAKEKKSMSYDVVIMDGVSASAPIFMLTDTPILFYCHYPDKLLCTSRTSIFKRMYRSCFIDPIEEFTTACCDTIVVNSRFTANAFKLSFPTLSNTFKCNPCVLYPTIDEKDDNTDEGSGSSCSSAANRSSSLPYTESYDYVYLSLNRYERKKNILLALDSLKDLKDKLRDVKEMKEKKILLVIAGGYDVRVTENVDYLNELCAYADKLGLYYLNYNDMTTNRIYSSNSNGTSGSTSDAVLDVAFRISISNNERKQLLAKATALLYTPDNEHFGIVPLEAMYNNTPVIAVNSGGPLETVIDSHTGYLCNNNSSEFSTSMLKIINNVDEYGINGRNHVINNFTSLKMKKDLSLYLNSTQQQDSNSNSHDTRRIVIIKMILKLLFVLLFSLIMYHL